MKQIKIVTSVQRTLVSNLVGMTHVSANSVRLPVGIVWQPLQIKPRAHLTISDKIEDKAVMWSAKLSFKTCEDMSDRRHYAYLCHLSNGVSRLIGFDGRPFPVLSVIESMPENVADNQLNEVTVDWKSARFIPSVVI